MAEPGDLASMLRDAIRKKVDEALKAGPRNVAGAINNGADGQSTSVYSDQDVTVVQHNGETRVFRHGRGETETGGAVDT
jgi:hypothetical protein